MFEAFFLFTNVVSAILGAFAMMWILDEHYEKVLKRSRKYDESADLDLDRPPDRSTVATADQVDTGSDNA